MMSSIELFFLNAGLSYTLSKFFAYLVFPLIGFVIWLIVQKRIRKRGLKVLSFIVLTAGFFFVYFAMHPIYEGDFSNNSVSVKMSSELDQLKEDKLIVISIPNCPFCQESVSRMLRFQERHPDVKVEYRVCVADSVARSAIHSYEKLTKLKIPVRKAEDYKKLAEVAEMSFPSFVLVTKSKKVQWSNDNFGAGALDEVVNVFER